MVDGVVTTSVEVDVSDLVPWPGTHVVRGWVQAPRWSNPPTRPVVFFCVPGGRCTTGYFDLRVEGVGGYSMAEHLVDRGHIVVAFDHLGIGASSRVEDIAGVTPWLAAAVNDRAHRFVLDGLRAGTVVRDLPPLGDIEPVGVGHSMGGMLVGVQQAGFGLFDAVAVLGHGGDGLPAFLTEDERGWRRDMPDAEGRLVELTRVRAEAQSDPPPRLVSGSFLPPDLPDAVRAAYIDQQDDLLLSCGLLSMLPSGTDHEKSRITVPVLLAFGDHDLTTDPTGAVTHYPSSPDITLYVLADSAHCHNQAATRADLWDRLTRWIRCL
jgi:alpha-beta hydrolase superfamily lysophospholipase